jgi:RNA polymerase primary sigma factor
VQDETLTESLSRFMSVKQQLCLELRRPPTHSEWSAALGYDEPHSFEKAMHARREELVVSNLRLATWVARRYASRGVCFDDLVQEGVLGLIAAAKRYDPSQGTFATYATYFVHQRIGRLVGTSSSAIRLSSRASERLSRLKRLRYEHLQREGRFPTDEELASLEGISVSKLRLALLHSLSHISLEAPIGRGDGHHTLSDMLPARDADPAHALAQADLRNLLRHSLAGVLDPRDALVMCELYGLDGKGRRTLDAAAELHGCSRREIMKIRSRALQKLQGQRQLVVRIKRYMSNL